MFLLPGTLFILRKFQELRFPRFPRIKEDIQLDTSGSSAWVAELSQWPVFDDNAMLLSDEIIKAIVLHADIGCTGDRPCQ